VPDIFIELDRDFDFADPEQELPPRPSRFGSRWRPWVAAGVAVASMLMLGNAEFRPDSGVDLVAQFEVHSLAQLEVVGDALLVAEPELLSSYEPSSGERRWQVRTGLFDPYLIADGDLVRLSGSLNRNNGVPQPAQVSMAIEVASGEVRWQIPGYVEALDEVLIAYVYSGDNTVIDQQSDLVVEIYSRDGRRKLWSTPPSGTGPAVNPERSLLTTLDNTSGELTEHNLLTGAVVNRYTFPELVGANGFFYNRNRAMFFFEDGRQVQFDGINLTTDFDDRGPFMQPEPMDCGSVICQYRMDGSGFFLTDKETGRKILEVTDWDVIMRTEVGLLGLRFPQNEGPLRLVGMFDPRTGKKQEIKDWSVFDADVNGPQPASAKGPVYVMSYQNTLDYFGILKGDGVRTLGVMKHDGELRQCAVSAPHVACVVGANLVRLWRLT
jgi:hypothetical protein